MTAYLLELPFSPWSLRAKWALRHHGIPFRAVMHLPMVGEPALRAAWALFRRDPKRLFTKASVPILLDDGALYGDSFEIAEHADAVGMGTKLIPGRLRDDVLAWVDAADDLLAAGRMRLMDRLIACDVALREMLPRPLRSLGALGISTARLSSEYVKSKYQTSPHRTAPELEAAMNLVLDRMDRSVKDKANGSGFLLGEFTFADIAVAGALDMIAPRPEVPLGPETRKVWCEPQLAAAHPIAMGYRDRVFASHAV